MFYPPSFHRNFPRDMRDAPSQGSLYTVQSSGENRRRGTGSDTQHHSRVAACFRIAGDPAFLTGSAKKIRQHNHTRIIKDSLDLLFCFSFTFRLQIMAAELPRSIIGIDVSKASLAVCYLRQE